MNEQQCDLHEKCDMRKESGEFCSLWGCRCLSVDYTCTTCSVLSDLKNMASAFHIKFQIADNIISANAA